jgi:hypothetical protein
MLQYIRRLTFILFLALVYSCSTVKVDTEHQQKTLHTKILGSISETKTFVLDKDYNTISFPDYGESLKVTAKQIQFTKPTYRAFVEAKALQNNPIEVAYNDSLKVKPMYVQVDLADRIRIIDELKAEPNKSTYQFLKDNNDVEIVNSISFACETSVAKAFKDADKVVLNTSDPKNYDFQLYKTNSPLQTVRFQDIVVFAYQGSKACWKQNDKYQIELIDFVETNDRCPKASYHSAKRAKKRINYYKL